MTSALVTLGETVGAAVVSSGGLWTIMNTILSRRERKIDVLNREQAETDRAELLAEAQSTAQRTALESNADRYKNLATDYQACRDGLNEVRDAASLIIDVFDEVMMKLRPTRANSETFTLTMEAVEVTKVRGSISEARRHLLRINFVARTRAPEGAAPDPQVPPESRSPPGR
jgi:hypothetical protein